MEDKHNLEIFKIRLMNILTVAHNYYKRLKKIFRTAYYFHEYGYYVHGKIVVGYRKNIKIGKFCSVNAGVVIQAANRVEIGNYVVLSRNCMLLDSNLDFLTFIRTGKRPHIPNYIRINDYCWIGANSIILPGVELGEKTIVGAGSVVTKSFPGNVLIAGNPAVIIRKLV